MAQQLSFNQKVNIELESDTTDFNGEIYLKQILVLILY